MIHPSHSKSFTQAIKEETKQKQRQKDSFQRGRLRKSVYLLQRGQYVKKKLDGAKDYKERYLFLTPDLQSLALAKSHRTRHQAKVLLALSSCGGLQVVRGAPAHKHKRDAESMNFHASTFSIHVPVKKTEGGGSFSSLSNNNSHNNNGEKVIDVWCGSEAECDEWLKCLPLVVEALTVPEEGPRELVWSEQIGDWTEGTRHYIQALAEDIARSNIVAYMDTQQRRVRRRTMRRSTNKKKLMMMQQTRRRPAMLKPKALAEFMTFHSQPLKRAFHMDLGESIEVQALKAFRLVMQYMGDLGLDEEAETEKGAEDMASAPTSNIKLPFPHHIHLHNPHRTSSTSPLPLPLSPPRRPTLAPEADEAQQAALLRELFTLGETMDELRDELYVCVLTQTTYNPNPSSLVRGWQLLTAFSHTFLPSDEDLRDCVILHADRAICQYVHQSSGAAISGLAAHTYDRLTEADWEPRVPPLTLHDLAEIQSKVVPQSVFGCTLEEVLRKELVVSQGGNTEDTLASGALLEQSNVPLILQVLIRKFQSMNGYEVEGIFRRAAPTDHVNSLKKRLEDGGYVVFGSDVLDETDDPLVIADLIKIWLRHLAEPLIPFKFYSQAIDAGHASDLKLTVKLLRDLPPANTATLQYLMHFLNHCAELSKANQMTQTNLSIVMSPNLLRHPSNDPMVMVQNTEYERRFVAHLMSAVNGSNGSKTVGVRQSTGIASGSPASSVGSATVRTTSGSKASIIQSVYGAT